MTAQPDPAGHYFKKISIDAPSDTVFKLLTTLEGIGSWWQGTVGGEPGEGGELRFGTTDSDDYTQVEVTSLVSPSEVAWRVLEDNGYAGEWNDTTILFHLQEDLDGSTLLSLSHQGLTPVLDCFSDCVEGWSDHLRRIKRQAEASGL